MKLIIEERNIQGVSILELNGRVIMGEECDLLRSRLNHLLQSGKKKILLNLAEATFIDSSGVGMLVAMTGSAQNQQCQLKFLNASNNFQETLQVARLLTVLGIYKDETEALASFA